MGPSSVQAGTSSSSNTAKKEFREERNNSNIPTITATDAKFGHPLEKKYKSRIKALYNSKEVITFYARSSDMYNRLTREEKQVVKSFTKQIKQQKEKKRRHSEI